MPKDRSGYRSRHKYNVWLLLGLVLLALLSACQDDSTGSGDLTITVDVDGDKLVYHYPRRISVGQFLDEIGVQLGPDDEVNPLIQTQIRDGMRITVTRVVAREECKQEDTPYPTERQLTQQLPTGETEVAQTGENGIEQICYRITEKDGIEVSRVEISRFPIKEPRPEILYVGSEPPDTMIAIEGTLAYLSSGQAFIIRGNTVNLSPLTQGVFLDGRVFDLSPDGRRLLYTVRTPDDTDPDFANELWAILNTTVDRPQPVQLVPEDVRVAQWVAAQQSYTVSYSTATPQQDGGWQAYNDVYLMRLDPQTGSGLGVPDEVVDSNALGAYAYWGRRFVWSPDGTRLAWANADGVGLVDLEANDMDEQFVTLLSFREYAPFLERYQGSSVWVPTLSWSADGHLITTVHGAPYGDEGPEYSIVFNLGVIDVESGLQLTDFVPQTGIWANPVYSPVIAGPDGEPTYSIAYFQAREPLNSPGTEYDLVVMDRDGSNARVVFPGSGRPGLRLPDPEDGIAWSPNARQIALIHQGNLWVVDIDTELAYQITTDGQASRPRWAGVR
ncbi:MAG: G5 domain-containing protein [Anaerolineae bacterium]|nr:G5 domain-containing protein [Anaerolineae bacterium]